MSLYAEEGASRKSRSEEIDLDITPMIDVTFLLLIFFMVTSTMQANKDRNVPEARYGVGKDSRTAPIIDVLANGDNPIIMVRDEEFTLETLTPWVQERVAEGVKEVIIKAEGDLPSGFVAEVTRAVADVEGIDFAYGVRDP